MFAVSAVFVKNRVLLYKNEDVSLVRWMWKCQEARYKVTRSWSKGRDKAVRDEVYAMQQKSSAYVSGPKPKVT
jgi:hypothetical protein